MTRAGLSPVDTPADAGARPAGPAETSAAPGRQLAGPGAGSAGPGLRTAGTRRIPAWLAVGAALVSLILAPFGTGGLPAGSVARVVSGDVEELRGAVWRPLAPGDLVPEGARVRAGSLAELEIRRGTLELAEGAEAVLAEEEFTLASGSLLLDTTATRRVVRGAVAAEGRGVWRFDAEVAPRVGVYAGGVGVDLVGAGRASGPDGEQTAVSPYQQLDLSGGTPAPRPLPLRYLSSDPWDARLLAEAISVDRQVVDLTRSLTAAYGREPRPLAFYTDFAAVEGLLAAALPRLAPVDQDGAFGPPADTLVGVVVAELLVTRAALAPEQAAEEIRRLRRDGATWGLILVRRDLGPEDLRSGIDAALRRRAREQELAPPPAPPPPPIPPPEPSPPPPSPSPSPSPQPSPTPSPTPDGGSPLDPVLEDLGELLDDVIPGSGEAVDDARDRLGGAGPSTR